MSAPAKSVLNESKQIERAAMLIQMGARMQVLESETTLSYERSACTRRSPASRPPKASCLSRPTGS